jgi:hypothetical protein
VGENPGISAKNGLGKLDVGAARLEMTPPMGSPPTLTLTVSPALVGQPVTLTATIDDADGDADAALLRWDMNYDGMYKAPYSLGRTQTLTFPRAGYQRVIAEVLGADGLRDRALIRFEVLDSCVQTGCDEGCCQADGLCGDCMVGDVGADMDAGSMDTTPGEDTRIMDTSSPGDTGGGSSSSSGGDTASSLDTSAGDTAGDTAGPPPASGNPDDCACDIAVSSPSLPSRPWAPGLLGAFIFIFLRRRRGRLTPSV